MTVVSYSGNFFNVSIVPTYKPYDKSYYSYNGKPLLKKACQEKMQILVQAFARVNTNLKAYMYVL